ncbi:MAG TPA: AmmeMemoRadiSam system protein B [Vicinamibacteria bacterium]|nr:AmmeMemoRadiSam system protein B [Vicinamibacteria bacterium]
MTGLIRRAAVAGMFYPADGEELRRTVESLLAQAPQPDAPPPKALVAPHAGYVYSGPVAASAYARLLKGGSRIHRVVLLGPAHYHPLYGLATHSAQAFETPLGSVPLEHPGLVRFLDAAHQREHSLETQLPFLQVALGDFRLVPIVVGEAAAGDVAEVIDELWGGDETLIVVSTDLSHYHDARAARKLDRATADEIVGLRAAALGYDSACGRHALAGLLVALKHHGLGLECIDLRNSADTAGDPDRVVGYGAFVTPS